MVEPANTGQNQPLPQGAETGADQIISGGGGDFLLNNNLGTESFIGGEGGQSSGSESSGDGCENGPTQDVPAPSSDTVSLEEAFGDSTPAASVSQTGTEIGNAAISAANASRTNLTRVGDPRYDPKGFSEWVKTNAGKDTELRVKLNDLRTFGMPQKDIVALYNAGGASAVKEFHSYMLNPTILRRELLTGPGNSGNLNARWDSEVDAYRKELGNGNTAYNRTFRLNTGSSRYNTFAIQRAVEDGLKKTLNREQRNIFNQQSGQTLSAIESTRRNKFRNRTPDYSRNANSATFWSSFF